MIERLIYTALTQGIETITEDPYRIDQIFQKEHGLTETETEKIRGYFLEKPPKVIHGYARSDSDFPLFAITLGAENVTQQLVGDEGGMVTTLGDPDFGADERVMFFDETFNILIYAQNPDVCLYYYQLCKVFLFLNLDFFKSCGLYNIRFSGSDMAPDPAWVPAGLFLRRFTMQASEEYKQIDPSTKLGKAFRVRGIHVDKAGAPGESVGGVKTLVRPIDSLEKE